jgi:hypothetical protein
VNATTDTWEAWRKIRVKNDIRDVNAVLSSLANGNIWTMKRSRANPSKSAELTVKGHFENGAHGHGEAIQNYTVEQQEELIQQVASQVIKLGGVIKLTDARIRERNEGRSYKP